MNQEKGLNGGGGGGREMSTINIKKIKNPMVTVFMFTKAINK